MKARPRWSPQAQEDMIGIYTAIAEDSLPAAERMFDRLEEDAAKLMEHPMLGSERGDVARGARMIVVRPYLLFYEVPGDDTAKGVEILRVIHGHQDLTNILNR
jgi:toxin ParE1/3/4